mgnify:CR=1 FL=1
MDANVAERYAESLYQLALEDHALEDYLADMKLVDTVLKVIVLFSFWEIASSIVLTCSSLNAKGVKITPSSIPRCLLLILIKLFVIVAIYLVLLFFTSSLRKFNT